MSKLYNFKDIQLLVASTLNSSSGSYSFSSVFVVLLCRMETITFTPRTSSNRQISPFPLPAGSHSRGPSGGTHNSVGTGGKAGRHVESHELSNLNEQSMSMKEKSRDFHHIKDYWPMYIAPRGFSLSMVSKGADRLAPHYHSKIPWRSLSRAEDMWIS